MASTNSREVLNVKVNSLGEFSLKNIPAGEYVLLATQREKVLGMRTIRLPLGISPVVIDAEPFRSTGYQRVEY